MVQAVHASYEASKRFSPCQEVIDYAVVCKVDSLELLLKAKNHLDSHYIQNYAFIEPDINNEITAIATEPLYGSKRKFLSNFKELIENSFNQRHRIFAETLRIYWEQDSVKPADQGTL